MAVIKVNTAKPYNVIVEKGAIKKAPELISSVVKGNKIAVISDDIVFDLYGNALAEGLRRVGFDVCSFAFPNGEKSKNAETYLNILSFLAKNRLTRVDTVIALGGGVVGDIAGFASATYLRGIRYIQMPTTLLSAVDSSVGGKCAIDLDEGKNLAGAFHQPSLVICDPDTLDTLPEHIMADGCGEVIKYGILSSPELMEHLDAHGTDFDREYVISACVEMKAAIVAEDEFDRGSRALLNLGHTTAHAIEKLSDFNISHGAAVATGLAIAARFSMANGMCSADTVEKIEKIVADLGHSIKTDYTSEAICDIILSDKKRHGDVVDFICINEIGGCSVREVAVDSIVPFVSSGMKA